MSNEIFLVIFKKLGRQLKKINNQVVIHILILIIAIFFLNFFYSFIHRYINYNEALNDITARNFTRSVQIFDEPQPFFTFEEWRTYYNLGVVKFYNNNFYEALADFKAADEKLTNKNDILNYCRINYNINVTNEKIADDFSQNTDSSNQLRDLAQKYLDSFISRSEMSSKCSELLTQLVPDSDVNYNSINDSIIDYDHTQYNSLIQKAFQIDGKTEKNEIDEKISSNNNNSSDNDPKLNELYKVNITSEQESQKAKEIVKAKNENRIIKPW